ncbi:MAG TPA: hypothetical protein VHI50_04640 [Micromonosporaceae bacterium]|nr:hypothetical protein [Micromonosporaceae bacterium]
MAAPTPAPAADAAPPAGTKVCTITNPRLVELSGIIATAGGYVVMNDSSDIPDRKRIFLLNDKCGVDKEVSYSGAGPRDPEDLALSPDGRTLWIGDIGDNNAANANGTRKTIAVWKMPLTGSSRPVIHRMAYPEGDHHDAEALLIGGDGLPVIITKEQTGKAFLYKPTARLQANTQEGVPLRRVGEVTLPKGSTTDNPMKAAGRLMVTGAARSPDGAKVVLRTLADAFEYDVSGGDVVAALTGGTPRMTPLPNEPWGEAISYSPDGASYLTVSDTGNLANPPDPVILRYAPTDWLAMNPAEGGAGIVTETDDRSWWQKMSLKQMEVGIATFGGLGALLVLVGVFGILRARRRPAGGAVGGGAFRVGDNAATATIPHVQDDYGHGYNDGWGGVATQHGYDDHYYGGAHEPAAGVYRAGGTYQSSGVYGSYPHPDTYPADEVYGHAGAGQGGGQVYAGGQLNGDGYAGAGQYGEPEDPYDPAGYRYPDPDRR